MGTLAFIKLNYVPSYYTYLDWRNILLVNNMKVLPFKAELWFIQHLIF